MNIAGALGFHEKARLLIINADDFGLCHATNAGIRSLFEAGFISSASLMATCGWAREAALWSASHPKWDVGIHWTLTSEWDHYKWGPVNRGGSSLSLVTEEGYFPKDCKTLERQADPEEVRAELRAQVKSAIKMGLKPTHADNHMGSLYGLESGRDFLNVVFDVCAEFGLPFRLPRYLLTEDGQVAPPELAEQALRYAKAADAKGVIVLDYLYGLRFPLKPGEDYESVKQEYVTILKSLKPGVSEIIIHPSEVTPELLAFHGQPEKRAMELRLLQDSEVIRVMQEEGIVKIGWRELQHLQRNRRYRRNK
ncbi:polysaccharide deacetylase family protein [Paenibacillus tarimensis]